MMERCEFGKDAGESVSAGVCSMNAGDAGGELGQG